MDRAIRAGAFPVLFVCAGVASTLSAWGCNSISNGWLDPTILGNFEEYRTVAIRASLTLDDQPARIVGAVLPTAADLEPHPVEHEITGGDTLAIEINELRQRQVPFQTQVQVSPTGMVNLPVVGEVRASGLTSSEFQRALVDAIVAKNVLLNPEVTVNPVFLYKATYSIFGIGVSASNVAPLRAGIFPIRRPNLRLLDAINQVGGLNEFVTEVYIFRTVEPAAPVVGAGVSGRPLEGEGGDDSRPPEEAPQPPSEEQELLQVVEEPPGEGDERTEAEPPEEMEPEAVDPYLFLDGKFVRNPRHRPAAAGGGPADPIPMPGTVTPVTNWSRLAGESSQVVLVVPADRLREGDPAVNVVIRGGDVIRIVQGEIGVYYVMGQVNRVGAFTFNSEEVTLKSAIAAAGGLSGLAWPDRCTIYRRLGASEQMVQVNLDRIFAGLDDDFLIRRGDIINVGTHPFAPFLQRIRGLTLPNPTTNVGYGFTYARNFADIDSFAVQANPNNRPSTLQSLLGP